MELISSATTNLVCFYIPDVDERRAVYQFMETTHPNIGVIGVAQYDDRVVVAICDCGKPVELQYHTGTCDNNIDEYYSGDCTDCGEHHWHECRDGYTDTVFPRQPHQLVLMSTSIHRKGKTTRYRSAIDATAVLSRSRGFVFPPPEKEIFNNRLRLEQYVRTMIGTSLTSG